MDAWKGSRHDHPRHRRHRNPRQADRPPAPHDGTRAARLQPQARRRPRPRQPRHRRRASPTALDGVDTVLHLANGRFKEADADRAADRRPRPGEDPPPLLHLDRRGRPEPVRLLQAEARVRAARSRRPASRSRSSGRPSSTTSSPTSCGRSAGCPPSSCRRRRCSRSRSTRSQPGSSSSSTPDRPGTCADIEGPEQRGVEEFATEWFTAHGRTKRIWLMSPAGREHEGVPGRRQPGQLPGYGRGPSRSTRRRTAAELARRREAADDRCYE